MSEISGVEHAVYVEAQGRTSGDRAQVYRRRESWIGLVCDGAGGVGRASEGAAFVERMVTERIGGFPSLSGDALNALWEEIDDALFPTGLGEAAAAIAAIEGTRVFGASVGDSVAWVIGNRAISDLSAEQVRKPLLGSGRARPVAFEGTLGEGTLLLASDGLVKYASEVQVVKTVADAHDLDAAARGLVDGVRLRSGKLQDDVSVVLARRSGSAQGSPLAAPWSGVERRDDRHR